MKRWKTLLVLACGAALTGGVLAISAEEPSAAEVAPRSDGRPLVLATFTVIADMAAVIGGETVEVESITKPGAEVHGYEPTASDLKAAEEADLILENGMGLEAWFERFTANNDAPRALVSRGIDEVAIEGGEYDGRVNPHAWMSPEAGQIYAANIAAALTQLDPQHGDQYWSRYHAYAAELSGIAAELTAGLAQIPPQNRALVTCEGAFSYLTRTAGISEAYLWPVNAESTSTPRQVAATIDFVKANRVPAVFCESTVSDAAARAVADETDATFGGTLYVDSLSSADGPVPTYLELLRSVVRTVVSGLTGAAAIG